MSNHKHRNAGVALAAAVLCAGAVITTLEPARRAAAEPTTSTTTSETTTTASDSAETTTTTTTAGTAYPSDSRGYLDTEARCDEGQTLMAYGRTSRALVAICVGSDGQLEYRGVRLSDAVGLAMPANRGSGGTIVATNDGVTYSVSPEIFLVSEGDDVLYRDAWVEFREPRFPDAPASSSQTSESPTSSASPTTTVSTTTVTLSPEPSPTDG